MIRTKIKNNDILGFFITLMLFCCSGVIQFSYIWFNQSIIIMFTILMIIFIFRCNSFVKKNLIILSILIIIILINIIIYPINISGHIGLILKLFSVFLASHIIYSEDFKIHYRKIILFIAIISLVCYTTFLIVPGLITSNVPIVSYWQHNTRYMLLYNFPGNGYEYGQIRNFGPFHEGGMFAVYLDIGIFFVLEKSKLSRKDVTELSILVIALITTFSTSGFCVFIIMIIFQGIKKKKFSNSLIMMLCFIFVIVIELNYGIISNKFSVDNKSFTGRFSEFKIFKEVIINNPFFGIGYQNSSFIEGTGLINATNGVLSLFAQFGVIQASIFILINILKFNDYQKNKILVFRDIIIIVIFWMSEPTIFQPIFLLLLFIQKNNNNKSSK